MGKQDTGFFNREAWKGVVLAIAAVALVQAVLAWQYYRLEEQRLPGIERQLAEQEKELERQAAEKTVASFLNALREGNSELALRFLTENAVLQEQQGVFSLQERIEGYTIVKLERLSEGEFRAQVEIHEQALPPQVRLLRALKVLGTYYIDSVELAG